MMFFLEISLSLEAREAVDDWSGDCTMKIKKSDTPSSHLIDLTLKK